jgi:hypothetical protein
MCDIAGFLDPSSSYSAEKIKTLSRALTHDCLDLASPFNGILFCMGINNSIGM